MKPAWYYERQAQEAEARANYYRNRVPQDNASVRSRPTTVKYYRSLLVRQGTDPTIFKVSVNNAALALVTATQAGLLDALTATETALNLRGSGVKPTKIHWYKGDASPVGRRTAWNSRYIRYYDTAGTQSHYSMPFSRATGAFDPNDLKNAFNTLFSGSNRTTLLGAANGRAYLELEHVPTSVDT